MKCHKSRIYSRTVVPGPVYLMDWPLSALRNGDPKEIIQLCSCWKKVNRTFKRKCKRAALESLGLVKKEMRIIPVIVLIFLKFKNKFTDILRKEKKKKKNRNTNPAIGSHTHGWSVKHKMVRLSFPDTDVALNLRTRPLVVLMFRYTLEAGCWSQFRPNAHVSRENEAWHTKVTHPL